ncbi:MAG TPA: hypothetical protein VM008_10405 [Phycisphaerae bacterium]|nr:hypothetical protein [Phycisphaerae bacterium]
MSAQATTRSPLPRRYLIGLLLPTRQFQPQFNKIARQEALEPTHSPPQPS